MIAIYIAPLYLILIAYLIWHAIRFLSAWSDIFKKTLPRVIVAVVIVLIAFTLLPAAFLPVGTALKRLTKRLSNIWLAFFLYLVPLVIIIDLVLLILKRTSKKEWIISHSKGIQKVIGTTLLVILVAVLGMGMYTAKDLKHTTYSVDVNKDCKISDLKISLMADMHMGYTIGYKDIEKMVEMSNAMQPDLVLLAGDFYDNDYDALDDPEKIIAAFSKLESKYGVYACWGNHDISENILAGFTFSHKDQIDDDPRMLDLLNRSGIKLLNDEVELIDNAFYLVSRKDDSRAKVVEDGRYAIEELLDGLDMSLPIIVMEHQPSELALLSEAGVDVQVSGHVHDGQMFPGNITTDLMWENAYGYKTFGDMQSIVTSGSGVWGPPMRVCTISEVVELNIHFAGKNP